jgi:hypothetical protein
MILSENRDLPRIKSGAGFFGIMLYWAAADDAHTATSGLLAGLGTMPHEAERSVRNVAGLRFAPQ